jgi:hypothetical protein
LRFNLGDTDVKAPIYPDATYSAMLAQTSDENSALLAMARAYYAELLRRPTRETIGPDTFDYSGRLTAMKNLIDALEPLATPTTGKKKLGILVHDVTRAC